MLSTQPIHFRHANGTFFSLIAEDERALSFKVSELGMRSRKEKRTFRVLRGTKTLTCSGRECTISCPHVSMVKIILRDAGIPFQTLEEDLSLVQEMVKDFALLTRLSLHELEDSIGELRRRLWDEIRPRSHIELLHVLEQNTLLIRRSHLQCGHCLIKKMCVLSLQQGFQCLGYFLLQNSNQDSSFYAAIPLTEDALNTLDFADLLTLAAVHQLSLEVIPMFTNDVLRVNLLRIDKKLPYTLTV